MRKPGDAETRKPEPGSNVPGPFPDYPPTSREREGWIGAHRASRNPVDPNLPYAFLLEQERAQSGEIVDVATIFLTNRECPWRCLMCDLWRNTLTQIVPAGAIPSQIEHALARLPAARQIKLYNSGSFFDRAAIPIKDYPAIARRVRNFERVIDECHPALIGQACLNFRDLLGKKSLPMPPRLRSARANPPGPSHTGAKLEIAMGLETAHPEVLASLNKGMTLDQFASAARFLQENDIALRVFILVKPPFLDEPEALHWAK